MAESLRDRYEQFYAADRKAWRAWLRENHRKRKGVWLIFFKKASGQPRVPYDEAVEEALCFGWIDSVTNPLDEQRFMQLFTPRKPNSGWSRKNKERVAKLIARRKLAAAGRAAIEIAQKNGSWSKLDAVEALTLPPDLKRALSARKVALKNFEAFAPSLRKNLLHWIISTKRPALRAERIAQVVEGALENRNPRAEVFERYRKKKV
jgi:uncharacterized protein YdeI (YjbR/CyaY-like superfamily)